jgi:hypothetical protein
VASRRRWSARSVPSSSPRSPSSARSNEGGGGQNISHGPCTLTSVHDVHMSV